MSLTVTLAAQQLGISGRQVRRAIEEKLLIAERVGEMYVIQSRQLQAFSRIHHRGRHWTKNTQEAVLNLLTGHVVGGLSSQEKSRLKTRIATMDLQALVGQLMRGKYSLRRGSTAQNSGVDSSLFLSELGLSGHGSLSVLVAENAAQRARELQLAKDDAGNIVVVDGKEVHQKILEACAYFVYGDVREHSASRTWLEEIRSKM